MKTIFNAAAIILALAAGASLLCAQSDMRGHWSGAIETPAGSVTLEIDLDKTAAGWIGSASIPLQNASGIPLEAISFNEGKGSFKVKGAPDDPTFTGTLSSDGKTLEGQLSQGGAVLPLKFNRAGEAKVELAKASPPVDPEFLGNWEGTLDAGAQLRLVLTISNGKEGAEAVITSLDQGNAKIAVSAITQKGTKLTLEVKAVGGGYEAEINADKTQLKGTWTQLGMGLPLTLKKSSAAAAKP